MVSVRMEAWLRHARLQSCQLALFHLMSFTLGNSTTIERILGFKNETWTPPSLRSSMTNMATGISTIFSRLQGIEWALLSPYTPRAGEWVP